MIYLMMISGFAAGSIIYLLVYPKSGNSTGGQGHMSALGRYIRPVAAGVVVGGIMACLYKTYGFSSQFLSYGLLGMILAAASLIDLRRRIIPDWLVVPGAIAGGLMLIWNREVSWLSSLLALLAAGGILLALYLVTRGGIGLGDVKMFACAGMFLGLEKTLAAMLFATVISGITGLVLVAINTANRKKSMPFCPFILVGAVLALLV